MVNLDKIKSLAPALATALGGPLAGAAISIIAEVLGVAPTSDAVDAALGSNDPDVIKASLSRAEAAFKAEAEKAVTVGKQIDAHVEIVRMDYERGSFYSGWRPLSGWIAMLYSGASCTVVIAEAFKGSYSFLAQAPSVLMIGGPIMALAGIYAWQKSEERKAMASGGGTAIIGALKELIGKKRG
ncbi:MAG: hypothetical protein WC322_01415 [Candidatus Paceibacterota bacterium]|jgi:hypothetical protein